MESTPKCAWWSTRTQHALLGHLRPGSDLANCQTLPNLVHPSRVAQLAIGFHYGVPTSASRNAPLPTVATRVQEKGYDAKIPCAPTKTQCVWAKASWEGMELIHGSGDEGNRFYTEPVRPLPVLPRIYYLLGIHRRLHSLWPRRQRIYKVVTDL